MRAWGRCMQGLVNSWGDESISQSACIRELSVFFGDPSEHIHGYQLKKSYF